MDLTGRPVRVTSISFPNGRTLSEVAHIVDREAAQGDDLVLLPETWLGQKDHEPEPLDGPTITTMAALAAKHQCYVVCPIDRIDSARRFNTSVLIDRAGQVAGRYDKVYPYWSEFEVQPPVSVGDEAPVFEVDFGRLGLAICFDANFPEVWKRLADQGAELVAWSSAYSAGTTLQAHALNHHFYIVTSTQKSDCIVYDLTGQETLYEKSDDLNVTRTTLDLDRGIYHADFNLERRDRLLKERASEVEQERYLEREAWFVLRAARPGVSARALARAYGLEELRDYIERSRHEIDRMRGWPFRNKLA
jgi:predicted amidohydrolase